MVQALERFSFFLSVSVFLLPSIALFINHPFIKQKRLPALPWIILTRRQSIYPPYPLPLHRILRGNGGKSFVECKE